MARIVRRTPMMLLKARARVVRELVRENQLDPELGLSFAVWPPATAVEVENQVDISTLSSRAFSTKLNK